MSVNRFQEDEIEPRTDAELESVKTTPSFSFHRNAPCICGSGKKFKKCCWQKYRHSNCSVKLETYAISMKPLTREESKDPFEELSKEDEELRTFLYHQLQKHPETINSKDCDYFQKLNVLRAKYPNSPVILNYIGLGYQLLKLDDLLEKSIDEVYEKFPDYLFAKTGKANLYLKKGLVKEAHQILNKAHSLKQLYPNRDVFHITEFRAFEYFMVGYSCTIENIEQASVHLKLLERYLDEDDPLLLDARFMVTLRAGLVLLNEKFVNSRSGNSK